MICVQGARAPSAPGAPACDRPPDAAPGPRPLPPFEGAPDKGTPEPRSGRRPRCARLPGRPRAPTCTDVIGRVRRGPPTPTPSQRGSLLSAQRPDRARGPPSPEPHRAMQRGPWLLVTCARKEEKVDSCLLAVSGASALRGPRPWEEDLPAGTAVSAGRLSEPV